MKKRLIRTFLVGVFLISMSEVIAISSTAGPDKAVVEREARQIEYMRARNDIDGLIDILAKGTFPSKVKVAAYLKDAGDTGALPELERANEEFGGWRLETPCDDRSGIFAVAIWKIQTRDLPDAEKIDALIELLEGRGPIVPKVEIYDTVTVNGVTKKRLRPQVPNYDVGICSEQELERLDHPSLAPRLRKIENKGIAAYAVWRQVRDMPAEEAISGCVQIVHEEGRTQQYGAIHCLKRFEHPNAILALDILAGEGYSEAIRALRHFASRPDVFDRLCNHLLQNPYYVVRLFAVSAVRFTESESLRAKSLETLVRALYDPSEQVRRSAAQSLCNYIYPVTEEQLLVVREELLLGLKHPDAEVRDRMEKALSRVGWLDLDMPQRKAPRIRKDIEAYSYSKGGGLERRKRMIALLEQQAKEALEKGREDQVNEIYRKLSILEPNNQTYRSCLPREVPRFAMYYVKEDRDDTSLEEVVLDDYRLMTEQDIVDYDWDTHTITLTKEGVQRIPASSTVGVRGRSFVVVADGQRCYKGAFWTSFSSIGCPLPVIDVLRLNNQTRQVRIERAYPTAKFGQGADPIFDDRIRKVLEETGKLRHSKSDGGHAEAAVPLSEAARG